MQYYRVKSRVIPGSSYSQVRNFALQYYRCIAHTTKRLPYIKSIYFKKRKIFLHHFWQHLFEKTPKDRTRRLRFFMCGIELIRTTRYKPEIMVSKKSNREKWYRFFGKTQNNEKFVVQIKETKQNQLFLMSIFPYK